LSVQGSTGSDSSSVQALIQAVVNTASQANLDGITNATGNVNGVETVLLGQSGQTLTSFTIITFKVPPSAGAVVEQAALASSGGTITFSSPYQSPPPSPPSPSPSPAAPSPAPAAPTPPGVPPVGRRLQAASPCVSASVSFPAGTSAQSAATLLTSLPSYLGTPALNVGDTLTTACGDASVNATVVSNGVLGIGCARGDLNCQAQVAAALQGGVTISYFPPSPPSPPSSPPSSPMPSPPPAPSPPPPVPPPSASLCGCSVMLDGLNPTSIASDVCLKTEGFRVVCRPSNPSTGSCPSDMNRCFAQSSGQGVCADEPGRWASRKCARKLSKNKCHKRGVMRNCRRTCLLC